MKIAVLMACFNRVETTLRSLRTFYAAAQTLDGFEFTIFLVDDGSPDLTGQKVLEDFPEVVVTYGTGDLYWNRGMCLAYQSSKGRGKFDGYLLLNDDVEIFPELLPKFVSTFHDLNIGSSQILLGATLEKDGKTISYAGMKELSKLRLLEFDALHPNPDKLVECDTFNGNFVLVPGNFFVLIDGLDPRYTHGLGDIDLGLVARSHGIKSNLFFEPIGICPSGPSIDSRLKKMRLTKRIKFLFWGPQSLFSFIHFAVKHRPFFLLPFYAANLTLKRLRLIVDMG